MLNTIVIGAGQAGIAVSRCLQRAGIDHVVLEREAVGTSWRRRWDSFHLNTPNRINTLPDAEAPADADGFMHRDEWIATMEAYVDEHALPVRTGVEVRSVRKTDGGYEVTTSEDVLLGRHVVLCTGDQNLPRIPDVATELPPDVVHLHSNDYRSESALAEGGVLVVGSGQSGAQIVEDLLEAGRAVWLCTSKVGWGPRRYRGKDITEWAELIGMAAQQPADVDPAEREARQPMISGTRGGHSVSLHLLGNGGATLLGRLEGVEGRVLRIGDDLMTNVVHGDEGAKQLRAGLDTFIEKAGMDAPPAEVDPAERPFPNLATMAAIRALDLDETGIRSVIWATGFGGDFSYLDDALLDDRGLPRHDHGVGDDGLYCLGLMWQRRRISGLIAGIRDDAEHIVRHIENRGPD